MHVKKILKKFWRYINSKRTSKAEIGDLKVIDDSGAVITASDDTDKVEIFCNFFSSVFNTKSQACNHTLANKPTKFPNKKLYFTRSTASTCSLRN